MITSFLLRNQSHTIRIFVNQLGFLVTIILGDDSLNKIFFPKRIRCQIFIFFPIKIIFNQSSRCQGVTMVTGKLGCFVFSLKIPFSNNFWPKTSRKHMRNLVKPIHNHLKANKPPRTWNSPEIKILPGPRSIILCVFKVKKPKRNASHYMKHFDIKINCVWVPKSS